MNPITPLVMSLSLINQVDKVEKAVKTKREKVCLNPGCNNKHTHNNSFCSPECCQMYRDQKK